MEQYPSIGKIISKQPIIAFDKLDGSNLRAEWTAKNGFSKFGSRKRLLSPEEEPLGEGIGLFLEKYGDTLDKRFRKLRYTKATAFVEFFGEHSFAGFHEEEPHHVVLFDVHVYKKGILPPQEFLKHFEDHCEVPAVLHEGNPTEDFITSVKEGTLEGMTFEGVVCKGVDKRGRLVTFKVKNRAWLEKLKNRFSEDEALFNQLA